MLEHGGNLQAASAQYGVPLSDWLDLSTGINPEHYPLPFIPSDTFQRLPQDQDELAAAACRYYGSQSALPTAGSQAVIQVLPFLRSASRVAMPRTMYQEHALAWQRAGHELVFFEDAPSDALLAKCNVLLLCNPNNPTGRLFAARQLLAWHKQLQEHGGWLVVDEAFMDVTPAESLAAHSHLSGLWVLRSLGKFFGLAGLRVGFLLGEAEALAAVESQLGPWTLSGPSRYIARLALLDAGWQQQMRLQLSQQSQQLAALLGTHGLTPANGTGLFQYVPHPDSAALHHTLARQGIWTRLFTDTPAVRFGLPPADGWARLDQALAGCRA